jgi:hypothetical protein
MDEWNNNVINKEYINLNKNKKEIIKEEEKL